MPQLLMTRGSGNVPKLNSDTFDFCCQLANHVFFITKKGQVFSAGNNNNGQLGRSVLTGSPTTANLGYIKELNNIIKVVGSEKSTIFLNSSGDIYSCGSNNEGQLGRITPSATNLAPNVGKITGLSNIVKVFHNPILNPMTLTQTFFFINSDGEVYSCGNNLYGQLGRAVASGSETVSNLGKISGLSNIIDIFIGYKYVYFLTSNGEIYNCGDNTYGQLGRSASNSTETATNLGKITTLSNVKKVIIGPRSVSPHFLLNSGEVYNCGDNTYGQLGRAIASGTNTSVNLGKLTTLTNVKEIYNDGYSLSNVTIFLTNNNLLYSCGRGGDNKYGLGRSAATGSPTTVNLGQITSISNIKDCIKRYANTYVLTNNGSVYTFNMLQQIALITNIPTVKSLEAIAEFDGDSSNQCYGITNDNKAIFLVGPTSHYLFDAQNVIKCSSAIRSDYIITEDNHVYNVGYNQNGELARIVAHGPYRDNFGMLF